MLYLQTNTASQDAYINLSEGRDNLPSSFSDYLLVLIHQETGAQYPMIPTIVSENTHWTNLSINTTGIMVEGDFVAEFYGQNSGSNTNPNDESVVGKVHSCLVNLATTVTFVTPANLTIPAHVNR